MNELRCTEPTHNKKKITSINLSDAANQRLLCLQCIQQMQGENNICDLDEVMDNDHYHVYNYPVDPVGKSAKDLLQSSQSYEQIKNEAEEFFNNLKQRIISEIDKMKNIALEVMQTTMESKQTPKPDQQLQQQPSMDSSQIKDTQITLAGLKTLYDEAYELNKLKQIIKENAKQDLKTVTSKVNEFVNDAKRQEKIKQMKEAILKLGQNNQQNQYALVKKNKKAYEDRLFKNLDDWEVCFGARKWKFEVSKADQSATTVTNGRGLAFAGSGQESQIIYSNQEFSSGEHECVLVVEKLDLSRAQRDGNLFIGLVQDSDKDSNGYGWGVRRCLFSQNGQGMVSKQDFTPVLKNQGILFIHFNIDDNIFEIFDSKKTVVYTLDKEEHLSGKKWRLYIFWKNAGDQIKLLHSF